jgi:hypothetical protein
MMVLFFLWGDAKGVPRAGDGLQVTGDWFAVKKHLTF